MADWIYITRWLLITMITVTLHYSAHCIHAKLNISNFCSQAFLRKKLQNYYTLKCLCISSRCIWGFSGHRALQQPPRDPPLWGAVRRCVPGSDGVISPLRQPCGYPSGPKFFYIWSFPKSYFYSTHNHNLYSKKFLSAGTLIFVKKNFVLPLDVLIKAFVYFSYFLIETHAKVGLFTSPLPD